MHSRELITDAPRTADLAWTLGQFLDATPLGVVELDERGAILRVNPAVGALCGHRDLGSRVPFEALCHPAERARVSTLLLQIRRHERRSFREEVRVLGQDGTVETVSITATAITDATSEHLGSLLILDELTSRRRQEVETRHDQKLEAIGRLASGVAHEVNTPIQFIGDNLNFLSDAFSNVVGLLDAYRSLSRSDQPTPWQQRLELLQDAEAVADLDFFLDEVPEAITQALEGVERVAAIVRALKAFGHPDGDTPRPADLNEIVSNTLTIARNETKYVAEVTFTPGDLPPIACFAGDLGQVVLNLVVNAAHAISDAGRSHGEITVSTGSGPAAVWLEVADNGAGISREIQEHVFEPFFTTKEIGRGTGQGLALARALVDRHGGSIRFESEPGEGTMFHIELPRESTGAAAPAGARP